MGQIRLHVSMHMPKYDSIGTMGPGAPAQLHMHEGRLRGLGSLVLESFRVASCQKSYMHDGLGLNIVLSGSKKQGYLSNTLKSLTTSPGRRMAL